VSLASVCLLASSCAGPAHDDPSPGPWCGTAALGRQLEIENRIDIARVYLLEAKLHMEDAELPPEDRERVLRPINASIKHLEIRGRHTHLSAS